MEYYENNGHNDALPVSSQADSIFATAILGATYVVGAVRTALFGGEIGVRGQAGWAKCITAAGLRGPAVGNCTLDLSFPEPVFRRCRPVAILSERRRCRAVL